MVKVIAFDLVGVLVRERDVELNQDESQIEKLFGPNLSDEEFISELVPFDKKYIADTTKTIINKLYEVKDRELIDKLRLKYPDVKLVIATNHVSYIRKYIDDNFRVDKVFISAEMHKIKSNSDFYNTIAKDLNCKNNEILFIDDNADYVSIARESGMKSFKMDKTKILYDQIVNYFSLLTK